MKIREPSFFTARKYHRKNASHGNLDIEKRIHYKKEFLKRGGENNFIALDALSQGMLSPIEIVSKKNLPGLNLSWDGKYAVGELAYNAVDKRTKTIIIKIHLDQQETAIIQDIQYLLDLIKLHAKLDRLDLSAKRTQWDDLDKVLKVWDLHDEKKSWREIAKEVLPNEDPEAAMQKVRNYYKVAQRLIKEQGERL